MNQYELVLEDQLIHENRFIFLESYHKQLELIKKIYGAERAFELYECIANYALYKKEIEPKNLVYLSCIPDLIDRDRIKQRKSKSKRLGYGYVYIIKVNEYYKIGQTSDPDKRMGEYTKLMIPPEPIICIYCKNYLQVENDLHKMFANKNSNGEWFTLSDADLQKAIDYLHEKEVDFTDIEEPVA